MRIDHVNAVRSLCAASEARLPLVDADAVTAAFADESENLISIQWLAEQLRSLLPGREHTGLDVTDLRKIAATFTLERAIGQSDLNCDAVLDSIAACIPNGTDLRPLDDKSWEKAIDIGRALAVLKAFPMQNARLAAVADAGRRLRQQGYKLSVNADTYRFGESELELITERIRATFAEFGPAACLGNLFCGLKSIFPFDFDMYLLGRHYAQGTGARDPSFPFGFLVNLAVKVPFPRLAPREPERKWKEAFELSRDLVSALNLEAFSAFAYMNTPTTRIEAALRELAHYDHLFSLRQWRLVFSPFFLNEFFASDYDDIFASKLNWAPADAADLCRAITHFATRDPNVITISALRQAGVKRDTLDRMLHYFVHPEGSVNAGYVSPLCATKGDLMFKPLIQVSPHHVLLPAASLMGPAFYEATISALRPHISKCSISELQGKGTERVVRALFLKAKIPVSFVAAEYDLGNQGAGDCDLVIETNEQILLVECKAKTLTRGAMAGTQGDALLDFAGGMFAAQTQALRHERILRSLDHIEFKDGSCLEWRNRRITRLSVTLLDHGALQDRMMLANSLNALRGAQVNSDPGYAKATQVEKFNRALNEFRYETDKLVNLGLSIQALNGPSLSVGQLEVLLDGVADLEQFRKRMDRAATFMSFNPLFEFFHLRKSGIAT